ncbi:MAG: hypothetical protein K0U47_10615 [Epsilonproteobacteria bacterium]|nr:hypothetical protein [Campylobacterota bacterium]
MKQLQKESKLEVSNVTESQLDNSLLKKERNKHEKINISSIARANAKSIANQLTVVANGIGESKKEARSKSELKGQNGQVKSEKVHSLKAMDNFRSVSKNYFQHIKNTLGGKIEKNINAETVKDYILTNLIAEKFEGSTANTYLSILEKTAESLEKLTNKTYITKAEFKQVKDEIKKDFNLQKLHRNRAYKNPQAIQKEMERFSEFALSSKLQIELGMRIDDAIDSSKWSINSDRSITITDSKAGITYTTKTASKELEEEITVAKASGYQVPTTTYANELKEAVENTDHVWKKNSSHGLRYNFAQNRLQELIKEGKTYAQAKGQVSLEMGHSRLSITDTYTSFK